MRVAISVNTSFNIYNFRSGIIKALLDQGHQVVAIAPRDEFTDKLIAMGCQYYEVSMDNKGSNPLKDMALIFKLLKAYKVAEPDVVLQYTIKPNIYGSLAARMAGIPVINNVSGLGTVFLHSGIVSSIAKRLYKIAFCFPFKIFFQNEDDRELFIDLGIVKADKTDLVPGSGINLEKFKPAAFQRHKPFQFLLIARVLYDKGISEYADAIKILRSSGVNAEYVLMGSLDLQSKLGIPEDQVRNWEKEGLIKYLGFEQDIMPVIKGSDCVVLPSYREGTPKTLLEAAALGKPIVTTDVPGCKEVVEDKRNGYLCRVKDAADLADKMHRMFDLEEDELKKMGENSRKLAETKFDEKIVIAKYLKTIAEATRKSS